MTHEVVEGDRMLGALGDEMDRLLADLFPLCRSITGNGVRDTLARLRSIAEFDVHEVPSGTRCFDWTVPEEWNVRGAYIADARGRRLVDFARSNLHLVSYSTPLRAQLDFAQLRPHLHTIPELPDAIPYRTTYYRRDWGFCLTQRQLDRDLDPAARYDVVIDADLIPGSLSYAEAVVQGTSGMEFLFSSYCCHPSLANDNLSGLVLWTYLLRALQARQTRHTYRFFLGPETIGALVYLSVRREALHNVVGGFVLTTVGGPGPHGYKETFLGDHLVDLAVRRVFGAHGVTVVPYSFDVSGSDERQYSSPAFRIPMGTITKDKYYEYPAYHTSLDDLDLVRGRYVSETLDVYLAVIDELEKATRYRSLAPEGEPMLGRRGLYPTLGGQQFTGERRSIDELQVMRWLLFLGDGQHTLHDVAARSGVPLASVEITADRLAEHRLIEVER